MAEINSRYSPRAMMAAIGLRLRELELVAPITDKVKIALNTIKHQPLDKLQDGRFII